MSEGVALVVGHKGQDGQLIQSRLAREGSTIVGLARDAIEVISPRGRLQERLRGEPDFQALIEKFKPDEIYFLAATHTSSEVARAHDVSSHAYSKVVTEPSQTYLALLEAVAQSNCRPPIFFASSALVFEDNKSFILNEQSSFEPASLYGISKAQAMWLGQRFVESFGLRIFNGILFNHESHLRKQHFFTSRVIRGALAISNGRNTKLELGGLDGFVDWGYAHDFVEGFIAVLRRGTPGNYLLATGVQNQARRFVDLVFKELGLEWREHVEEIPGKVVPRRTLGRADISKVRNETGWAPKTGFEDMVSKLVRDFSECDSAPETGTSHRI